ncbi:serine/threonine protein kinase [Dermabacteraceae bacterium TAE3-ERU27]|nr:serine/threonine protein kinase [Dermabacteraceae bacterium TAE3-ERU27]
MSSSENTPVASWVSAQLPLLEDSGYRIGRTIGSGGMGIVYEAVDADSRTVALKVLRPGVGHDPSARSRLAREVDALKRVKSDNIARVLDAELEEQLAFVVTEYIAGPTLENAVQRLGGLHPEVVREIGLILGETLRDIHAAGLIHRDLKPSNIMLREARDEDLTNYDPRGAGVDPVIIDFGIAQVADDSRLTSTGMLMGTASFLDPHVARSNSIQPSADWWAWAAVLAYAATGREPFGAGRADHVFLRASQGEVDLAGIPEQLASFLRLALSPDVSERPSPDELLYALERLELDPDSTRVLRTPLGGASEPAEALRMREEEIAREAREEQATAVLAALETNSPEQGSTAAGGQADRTEMLPAVSDEEALPVQEAERTQVLPVVNEDWQEGAARTRALPVSRAEALPVDKTETLPVDRTEVLPAVAPLDATRPLPLVRSVPEPEAAPAANAAPLRSWDASADPYAQPSAFPVPVAEPGVATDTSDAPLPPGYVPPPRRHHLLVWVAHLSLTAVAAVVPLVAVAVLLLMTALVRTIARTRRHMVLRTGMGKGRVGTSWVVGLALPLRFAWAVVETLLIAIIPAVLGIGLAGSLDALLIITGTYTLPEGAVSALAFFVMLVSMWLGIGGRTTRDGAHVLADAAAPNALWGVAVGGLLLLFGGAAVTAFLARSGAVDLAPLVTSYGMSDLPWRSLPGSR